MLERESPIPLYVQIERDLRDQIEAEELKPGNRVPSEIELAKDFGVSRMTARKAIDRLVMSGLLFRRQGKGTFVSTQPIEHGLSTKLSFSAAMEALGKRHETRVIEAERVAAPRHVAKALEVGVRSQVIRIERLRLVEGEPVALHDTYLNISYSSILDENLERSLNDAMIRVGARVANAKDVVSATLADELTARCLGLDTGAPILRIIGTGFSDAGEPLRYTEAQYRGDRFRFDVSAGPPSQVDFDISLTG